MVEPKNKEEGARNKDQGAKSKEQRVKTNRYVKIFLFIAVLVSLNSPSKTPSALILIKSGLFETEKVKSFLSLALTQTFFLDGFPLS